MASATASQYEFIRKVLDTKGIQREVIDIKIKAPSMAGDQFASRVEFWTVHFQEDHENHDRSNSILDLFVKNSVSSEVYAAMLREMQMFEKEAGFFNELSPDLMKLFKGDAVSKKEMLERSLPKCYYADKDLVVLENVAKRGFGMTDKLVPHNEEQARKTLRILASLHGTSYALIQSIGLEKCLQRYPFLMEATLWSEKGVSLNGYLFQGIFEGAGKILQACPTEGSDKVLEYVKQFPNLQGFWRAAEYFKLDDPQACAKVINHGDCWSPNFMWRTVKGATGDENECLMIDFQSVHVGSPALDLEYYLLVTVDTAVRRAKLHELLKDYYDTLQSYSEACGVALQFSFEELVRDFHSKLELGFIFSMFSIFGLDSMEAMGDVGDQDDMQSYFATTVVTAVEKNLAQKGQLYSKRLVQAYKECLERIDA